MFMNMSTLTNTFTSIPIATATSFIVIPTRIRMSTRTDTNMSTVSPTNPAIPHTRTMRFRHRTTTSTRSLRPPHTVKQRMTTTIGEASSPALGDAAE